MRPPVLALSSALLLAGCQPGIVTIGAVDDGTVDDGTTPPGEDGSDDTGAEGGDDTGGGGADTDEEPVFAYEGDYEGDVQLFFEGDWGRFEIADCALLAEVNEDGGLDGIAACEIKNGPGHRADFDFLFFGEVNEDGEASGEMALQLVPQGTLPFVGVVHESGEMDLSFYGEYRELGGAVSGEAALDRL